MAPGREGKLTTFCVLSGLALFFWGGEIYQRSEIALNGKVVASETTCVQPQNNRCATKYVVEDISGRNKIYVAGPNDHSLPRRLPIGTVIAKEQWKVGYSIDGRPVDDFPFWAYVAGVLTAIIGSWWVFLRGGGPPNTSLERTRER